MAYEVGLIQGARDASRADVVVIDSRKAASLAPWIRLSFAVLAGLP
jgi:hypothetical protein